MSNRLMHVCKSGAASYQVHYCRSCVERGSNVRVFVGELTKNYNCLAEHDIIRCISQESKVSRVARGEKNSKMPK